jgi:hypothetical protein
MTPIVHVTSPLRTPFGLVIPLLQSSTTRNYNRSQLYLTLYYLCTAYNHKRSWLVTYYTLAHKFSLLTQCVLTGWLLSYQSLSLIITHCRTRKVFNSLLGKLLITDLEGCSLNTHVELLSQDCLRYISNWAYVAFSPFARKPVTVVPTVAEQRTIDISPTVAVVSQWRDCLLRCLGDACDVTAACSSPPAERGDTERTPLPLPRSEACILSRVGWRTAA